MPPRQPVRAPQLLTVSAAAELLSVSTRTIHNWISQGRIPYLELPGSKATYRIPLHGLLATLRGNYDLEAELQGEHENVGIGPAAEPVERGAADARSESAH
jgi:excisionase family DNA binding protein